MKKVLLGTSAIALAAAVAAPANAAEVELKVGGFVESWIGFASTDVDNNTAAVDLDGVDAKWDGEIFFLPSITLDNGIKIGANIQLEGRADAAGNGTPDVIDEAYLFIKGSFGEVLIGDENSAGYKMTYAAPDVSFLGVNSPSSTIFVPYSGAFGGVTAGADLFRRTLGTTYLENVGGRNNDAGRITYFTPRFAGFQLGVSYARDAAKDTPAQINTAGAAVHDIFDIGANYVNSFGGVDLAISGRWGIASDDRPSGGPGSDVGENPEVWGVGASVGFAGFTVGGGFAEQNNAQTADGTSYTAGVSYRTGPWGFSVTYFHGENVNNESATALTGNDEEVDNFIAAVDYDVAKGVDVNLVVGYTQFEEETGDAGGRGDDIDGFYIATGVRLRF